MKNLYRILGWVLIGALAGCGGSSGGSENISTDNVFVLPIRNVKATQDIEDFKAKRDAYVKLLEQQDGTLTDREMQPYFDYANNRTTPELSRIFIGFTSFQKLEKFTAAGNATSGSEEAKNFFGTFDFIDFLVLKPNNPQELVDLKTLAPAGSGQVWEIAVRDLSKYQNFNSVDYKTKRDAYLKLLSAQPGFVREIQWADINNPNKVVGMTIYQSQKAVVDINSDANFNAQAQATRFVQDYPPNVVGMVNLVLK